MFDPQPYLFFSDLTAHLQGLSGPGTGASNDANYGLVLLGWLVVALLGLVYAFSPRLRKMIPRYFWNHRFYQDAVRRGRETIPVETILILTALSLSVGLTAAVWLNCISMGTTFADAAETLPPGIEEGLAGLVQRPWITAASAAAAAAVAAILWSGWLMLASRRTGKGIRYEQAFMLTVWPHWVLFMIGGLAWISAGSAPISAHVISGLWLLIAVYATGRVVVDVLAVARIPSIYFILLVLFSPLPMSLFLVVALTYRHGVDPRVLGRMVVGM